MKKGFWLAPILACIFLSCGNKDQKNGAAAVNANSDSMVRVAVMPTLDGLPYFIAMERGMFEKQHLNIKLVPFRAHMDVDTALIGGSVDAAFTDVFRTEQLKKKYGIKLVYLTATELYWKLISNRIARINSLDQFGDKIIAMTRISATDHLQNETFDKVKTKAMVYGVQINDVMLRQNMLLNNELDGAWLPEPMATRVKLEGNKELVDSRKRKEKMGVIVLREKSARKYGGQAFMEKMQKVYSEACDSINKYGIKAYSQEIKKYCRVTDDVVNNIPDAVYIHSEKPKDAVVEKAKRFERR